MCAIDLAVRAAAHPEFLMRAEDSAIHRWTELAGYVRVHDIDLRHLARLDLTFGLMSIAFVGARFEFTGDAERDAEPGAAVEVIDADAVTVIDIVAWSTADPSKFGTLLGHADALGVEHVANPATYFGEQPLRVFRTPLRWLQARCRGVVVLNPATTQRWLAVAAGRIVGEDIDLADAIGGGGS